MDKRRLAGYSPWGHKKSDMTEVTERASQGRKLLVGEGNVEKYIHDFGDVIMDEF